MSHREKSDDTSTCRGYFSAYGVKPGHDDAEWFNSKAMRSGIRVRATGRTAPRPSTPHASLRPFVAAAFGSVASAAIPVAAFSRL